MGNYLDIIKQLSITDFKLKYNCSILGYFWSLIRPLIDFLILFFVFSFIFKTDIKNYPIYLFLGLLYWNFFSDSSYSGISSLVKRGEILKNIGVKPYVIIFSSSLVPLITFVLNLLIFLLIALFFKISMELTAIFSLLFLIIIMFIVSLSMGLIFAKYNVAFRDVDHIYSVLLSAAFWLSPIVYSIENIPQNFKYIYLINPIARIIVHARDVFISNSISNTISLLHTFIIILLFFIISVLAYKFNKLKIGDYL